MEKLFTLSETADILRCSIPTIRRYIKKGALKALKSGGTLLVTESAIETYLQNAAVKTITAVSLPVKEDSAQLTDKPKPHSVPLPESWKKGE